MSVQIYVWVLCRVTKDNRSELQTVEPAPATVSTAHRELISYTN